MMFSLKGIQNYVELTKPRIVLLLVLTALAAMIVASNRGAVELSTELWFLGLAAITLGCAGCNVVTCYFDRDIDAIMVRTRNRPLPSGRIKSSRKVLFLGLILIGLSFFIALTRNFLSFSFMALGAFDNVVIYSLLLKRRNPVNIVLGGISGGLPVAFGWAYISNGVSLTLVVMATLVILWIPNHIWSLALRFKEDYGKAGVPMLPVIFEEKTALRCVVSTTILLVVFSLLLFSFGSFGFIYLIVSAILGFPMLLLSLRLLVYPSEKNAWVAFKFSSPYLALVFLAMIIDTFF